MSKAYIAKLKNVRKHPAADKLQLATCLGFQVVVGLDVEENELGIFFPADLQLSEEFCKANNLIGYIDENGARQGGFFDEKRKVRAQKFRGKRSEGFWCDLGYLTPLFGGHLLELPSLVEGFAFDTLNGVEICRRYETEQTRKEADRNKQGHTRKQNFVFPKHADTAQFLAEVYNIEVGSKIIISEKLHGTSDRQMITLQTIVLPWYKHWINKIYHVFEDKQWKYVQGTRNTVLTDVSPDYHGDKLFRMKCSVENLQPGEIIFGEIVGYTTQGKPIMSPQPTSKTKDKAITKLYGQEMIYSYGCNVEEQKLYLYRIAHVDEYGLVTELPYDLFVNRAHELNQTTVPVLSEFIYDGNVENLQSVVEFLAEGSSTLDNKHIKEGVVVRVETQAGRIYFLKYKSFMFKVLEGLAKEDENYIDTEEAN